MGGSTSRIWTDICAIESEQVRIKMIETVLRSPEVVAEAKRNSMYDPVIYWLNNCRQGNIQPFPYATNTRIPDRWSMYTMPTDKQIIVSPAAKALDYFQESLALLGIDDSEGITVERLKAGYRAASLRTHPDKGGSKEAFDQVMRAYKYIEKILLRINPNLSKEEKQRLQTPVTMENALAGRISMEDKKPIQLSAKKLDMGTFNRLFEENRLSDPGRDTGYGDWLSGTGGTDEVVADPRLKGKFNQQTFETVFRERAIQQTAGTTIVRRLEPDAIMPTSGTELGGDTTNFTAPMGADVHFADLKEAYTTGSTRFHEVADVQIGGRTTRTIEETKRMREAEMARVDPDESARIAAAAAALEERERQRRVRLAQQDVAGEGWADHMRRRLLVSDT
jgi:curved DNA-binding protein CbpA